MHADIVEVRPDRGAVAWPEVSSRRLLGFTVRSRRTPAAGVKRLKGLLPLKKARAKKKRSHHEPQKILPATCSFQSAPTPLPAPNRLQPLAPVCILKLGKGRWTRYRHAAFFYFPASRPAARETREGFAKADR